MQVQEDLDRNKPLTALYKKGLYYGGQIMQAELQSWVQTYIEARMHKVKLREYIRGITLTSRIAPEEQLPSWVDKDWF